MKRLILSLALAALLLLPNPPKQPMKKCGSCKASNEPWRTTCRSCGTPF